MTDNTKAQVTLRADDSPMRQTLREMLGKFRDFGSGAKKSVDDVGGSMSSLRSLLIGAAGALSGGMIAGFLKQTINLQDEMSKAAQKAGVTTEQFSGMSYAAKLADVSTEQLTKAYAKLGATLADGQDGQRQAVELFQRLKLDPKNIKDADALLLALAERFAAMPDGARKTSLAIDVLGERLGPGLIPFLNAGRGGIEELRKEAERLGVVISTEQGKQAEEFNDNLTKLGVAARGAANEIIKALLPALSSASEYFVKATKDAGLFKGTLISIGALMAKAIGVDETGRVASRINALNYQAALLKGTLAGVEKELQRDPTNEAAQRKFRDLSEQMRIVAAESNKAVAELNVLEPLPTGDTPPPKPPRPFVPTAKKTEDKKDKAPGSDMSYYETMLAEEKSVAALLNAGREYTKEQELQFWRFLTDNVKLNADDTMAIRRKTAALEIEIARKSAQDRSQIDADFAATSEKFALGKVDAEAAAARIAQDLGATTKAQLLAQEVEFEQQRYAIQASALQERLRLAALDPNTNPAELERIKNALLLLEQQHQTKRMELFGQQAKEEGSFSNVLAGMVGSEEAWNSLFNGLLHRTLTWQQAMNNIFGSVGQAFMSEFVTKSVAGHAKGLALMLAQKLGFVGAEKSADAAGAAATVAIKSAETTAVVGANATEAATGAAASQAAIPVVGPYMALAAMGAMFAAVMAMGSKSARGGYDIPRGANPMTQLHEEEMVLPGHIANPLRRMLAGGGNGGATSIGVTMNINTPDADSFRANADRVTSDLRLRLESVRRGI